MDTNQIFTLIGIVIVIGLQSLIAYLKKRNEPVKKEIASTLNQISEELVNQLGIQKKEIQKLKESLPDKNAA